jgi:hypothetical protein
VNIGRDRAKPGDEGEVEHGGHGKGRVLTIESLN